MQSLLVVGPVWSLLVAGLEVSLVGGRPSLKLESPVMPWVVFGVSGAVWIVRHRHI